MSSVSGPSRSLAEMSAGPLPAAVSGAMTKSCPYYSATRLDKLIAHQQTPEPAIALNITSRPRKILLTLAGLWLLLYGSFTLFSPPLLDDADSVHAEVAREMVERHDWITLYANGIRYLEKAPLMYWSMAASFTVFGPQDWAARLPLAIYSLALFITVYLGGPRFF